MGQTGKGFTGRPDTVSKNRAMGKSPKYGKSQKKTVTRNEIRKKTVDRKILLKEKEGGARN